MGGLQAPVWKIFLKRGGWFEREGGSKKKFLKSFSEGKNWSGPWKNYFPQTHVLNYRDFHFLESFGHYSAKKVSKKLFFQKKGLNFPKNNFFKVLTNFWPQKMIFRKVFPVLVHFSRSAFEILLNYEKHVFSRHSNVVSR